MGLMPRSKCDSAPRACALRPGPPRVIAGSRGRRGLLHARTAKGSRFRYFRVRTTLPPARRFGVATNAHVRSAAAQRRLSTAAKAALVRRGGGHGRAHPVKRRPRGIRRSGRLGFQVHVVCRACHRRVSRRVPALGRWTGSDASTFSRFKSPACAPDPI